ncbi:MAG: PHP domain-containing protein [Armatimonadota bacterium]
MYETTDLHIHTHYLGCADETMTIPAIVEKAEELGFERIAITDHLNAPEFLDDHRPIRDDLEQADTDVEIIFGVEVNSCGPGTGEVTITQEQIDDLGFELVIGGVHGSYFDHADPEGIIELQQELMLDVVRHPLVDVLVHPWWFGRREFEDGTVAWLTDMSRIPDDYAHQLGEIAAEHETAVEANACAIFTNDCYTPEFVEDYCEYLHTVASEGAKITIASDAHNIERMGAAPTAGRAVREAGITPEQLYIGD